MVTFRTQHVTDGVTDVTASDSWTHTVEDGYRRLVRVDLVGDVEREIYALSKDDVKYNLFGDGSDTVDGEGDLEVEVELEKDDELVIDYQGSGQVSDVFLLRTDRPLGYRVAELTRALETNEV